MDSMEAMATTNTNRTGWGGVLLTLGILISIIGYVLFLMTPQATPTMSAADRAALFTTNAARMVMASWVGMFGDALMVLAALFLVTREVPMARGTLPASACWFFVALGSLLFLACDSFLATGMPILARSYSTAAAPFEAAEATINVLFGLSMLSIGVGTLGIFWGEASSTAPAIPKAASYVAIVGALAALLVGIGMLGAIPALLLLFPVVLLMMLVVLYLGIRIAMTTLGGTPAASSRIAKA
ncbi:MAG TPA: hypothetical protein VGR28_11505 [Candidatus Thermoplasmatota archaeon]|nr:hypothetical protein [Candidatus Thermoplasmatota archaeon]